MVFFDTIYSSQNLLVQMRVVGLDFLLREREENEISFSVPSGIRWDRTAPRPYYGDASDAKMRGNW